MIDRLFVIVGAGASYACAPTGETFPHDPGYWPPLTSDLFTTNRLGFAPMRARYASILAQYPLAKAAAAELSTEQSAVGLETILRERYRDSTHEHDRRIFRGVLPYLQDLLYNVSHNFTSFPQNYEALATKLLRLKEVVFISLNYDLLLDNALLTFDPRRSTMGWYIEPSRRWSLIKLHGSVDWGRRLDTPRGVDDFVAPTEELTMTSNIVLRGGRLSQIRGFTNETGAHKGELYYPALAAPVGETDELVCPPEHVAFLRDRLAATQPMHLLFIGYSGIDQEVVSLIRGSERGVKTLMVVDRDRQAAFEVAERLSVQGVAAQDVKLSSEDFDAWVRQGGLDAFIQEMTYEPF
jgi:hypothetical protein